MICMLFLLRRSLQAAAQIAIGVTEAMVLVWCAGAVGVRTMDTDAGKVRGAHGEAVMLHLYPCSKRQVNSLP